MAHELEFVNGVAQMAYTGETPWHGLGFKVEDDLTPAEFMKVAGLDWTVEKVRNFIEYNGKKTYTGNMSLVRDTDGKILAPNIGPDWEPIQNAEAFDFFSDLVEKGHMKMSTAGSLKNGQMIWALADIDESFEIFGGDKVTGHLLFSNPHVYGKSAIIDFTATRVVCNNTLTLALNNKSEHRVAVNHRTPFDAERVKEMMGIASNKLGTFKEAAEFLGSKRAKPEAVAEFFAEIFPVTGENKREKDASRNAKIAADLLESQPGADFAAGSWWQPFNAITFMADHVLSREQDTRLFNSWFGQMRNKKIEALHKAIEYAEAA